MTCVHDVYTVLVVLHNKYDKIDELFLKTSMKQFYKLVIIVIYLQTNKHITISVKILKNNHYSLYQTSYCSFKDTDVV